MSKVKQFHLREGTLVEGKSLGCLNVYLASDYEQLEEKLSVTTDCADAYSRMFEEVSEDRDQLKADSEVVADLVESRLAENLRLKAENERLHHAYLLSQATLLSLQGQDMVLRTQLDEARQLLNLAAE